jgi:3-methyladenine DNA glycosylase Tag
VKPGILTVVSPGWKVKPPKDDSEYFERMTKTIFTAGLSWKMVEKKWPSFRTAFSGFSLGKVARFSEKNVGGLLKDEGIVRNERKIRATVHNAGQFLRLGKEFGSFRVYLDSFDRDEGRLQLDLQERFQHVGPSTARMFLWSVGYPLTPNREEKKWMAGHH